MGTEKGGHPSRTISMQNNSDVLEYKQAWEEASLAGCRTSTTKGKYTEGGSRFRLPRKNTEGFPRHSGI